jgi:tetratricopeptide (TPR) repeat protein
MKISQLVKLLPSVTCALFLSVSGSAFGQDDLGTIAQKSIAAMNSDNWEEALKLNTQAIERFGKNQPMTLFGPKFGMIYYRKGICELKLKKWREAMNSFNTCYRDFSNGANPNAGNIYEKMSLLKGGEAAVGAQDWQTALTQFEKFQKERNKATDKYAVGQFHLGMAMCHYNLANMAKGNDQFEIALKNKDKLSTPESGIVACFQTFATACILKKDEQMFVDFVAKNRGELTAEPYAMFKYSPAIMKLAGEAVGEGMERVAMLLYQMTPSTDVAMDDVTLRLKGLGPLRRLKDGSRGMVKAQLETDLKRLEEDKKGKVASEIIKLGAMAYLNEKNGNIRGAYDAYLQLEKFYPLAEKREEHLFHLVRVSTLVVSGQEIQKYADMFLKAYPESEHVRDVKKLILSSLFYEKKYEACIEVGEAMLPKLQPNTLEHDICLYVLGGSYYYEAQFAKADPLLAEHINKYPQSKSALNANYFYAANLSRLQLWDKASVALDNFLKTYPDPAQNVFLAYALYDRSLCYHVDGKNDEAKKMLTRIIEEFSGANILDNVHNLLGNVEIGLKNNPAAALSFRKALEYSVQKGNLGSGGEALYSLVALLGTGKEAASMATEIVSFSDKYWKEYAENSPYQSRMAVAQLKSLEAVGRGDEGLERLRAVIVKLSQDPQAQGLEELINSYTEAYLVKHSPEQLKEHYYTFPGIRSSDKVARALFRIAIIGVFETKIKKTQDDGEKQSASAMIKILFQELKNDFVLKELSEFVLLRVGDYLRKNSSSPIESLIYYTELIDRNNPTFRMDALSGRADVNGLTGGPSAIDNAIKDFTQVFKESTEKKQREFAQYRIVQLLLQKNDYVKAAEEARVYLHRDHGFTLYTPQVGMLLARTFKERNMMDDALAMYVKIWSTHIGVVSVSAPAMIEWIELSCQRNKVSSDPAIPSDRQGAYENGSRYIKKTMSFKEKMTPSDLALWSQVELKVKELESTPGIKSMAQVQREKEEAEKKR